MQSWGKFGNSRFLLLTVAVLVAVSIFAAGMPAVQAGDIVTFEGHVYEADGVTPAANAGVSITYPPADYGIDTGTDSNGYYRLERPYSGSQVKWYAHFLERESEEARHPDTVYTIDPNGTVMKDFVLRTYPVVFNGHVDIDGKPASDATVHVHSYNKDASQKLDSTGDYNIPIDFTGYSYDVWVSYAGHEYDHYTVQPSSGDTVTKNWALENPEAWQPVVFQGTVKIDGSPAWHAFVYVSSGEEGNRQRLDSTGRYSIRLDYTGKEYEVWVSYNDYDYEHWKTTPKGGIVVTKDWNLKSPPPSTPTPAPASGPTAYGYILFSGYVFNGTSPAVNAEVHQSYGGFSHVLRTNDTGYYQTDSIYWGGNATVQAFCAGNSSEIFTVAPATGSTIRHDFYFDAPGPVSPASNLSVNGSSANTTAVPGQGVPPDNQTISDSITAPANGSGLINATPVVAGSTGGNASASGSGIISLAGLPGNPAGIVLAGLVSAIMVSLVRRKGDW